jgi:long-chain fatty acid transport protein
MTDPKWTRARVLLFTLATIAIALFAHGRPALAGGFFLYEIATSDLGLASAGYAARAQDASTVFTNPAGMTLLDHSQLSLGGQPIYTHLNFAPDASTTTRGTDGGQALVPVPSGSFFYVYSVNSRLKFGFAMCGYFGGAVEYNLNWVGRYFLQGATILSVSFIPAVAFRVNDWLSVGGGVNAMVGFLREKAGVRNLAPGSDGQVKYQDYTAGVGGDIGVMFQPDEKTRIGITYLTPVALNFSAVPHFRGTGPVLTTLLARRGLLNSSVDLGMTVPQEVMVGVYREVTDRLALLGSTNWQNQSQFGMVGIGINSANPKNLTENLNYQDTWQIAAGMQYKVSPQLLFSAGFAYDSSMVTDGNRTVSAPVGAQYRYAAGAQYRWSEHLTTGLAYELYWEGKMPLEQSRATGTTVSGQFTNTLVNFFALNLVYVF